MGFVPDTYIHPTALVETQDIGPGTRIWAFSHVMKGAVLGSNCNVGDHCFIESGVFVGNNVTIKNGNMLWEGVRLEDGVFVGPGVIFTNDLRPRSPRLHHAEARYQHREWLLCTIVAAGASLGAGAILLPGLQIGRFAMAAAGAVVTRNVPDHALVVGNPARVAGWVCFCGRRLLADDLRMRCDSCGQLFRTSGERLHAVGDSYLVISGAEQL
jgi:acetyltransferase-like isoleucine patch superfamily enzyme